MANDSLSFELVINGKTAKVELASIDELVKKIQGSAKGVGNTFKESAIETAQLTTGLNQALEVGQKLYNLFKQPLVQAGQFEQYLTTLKVMLGSIDKAKERFSEVVDFAIKTPYNVGQVMEAANQLQTVGQYSQKTLKMLGDLASASGRSMQEAMSAYINMVTGRTGMAVKQFRMMLISNEDWMAETHKKVLKIGAGQTASVEEMMMALPKIIKKKGFVDMMDQQSLTYKGMVSNMEDNFTKAMAKIGEQYLQAAKDIVGWITNMTDKVLKSLYFIIPVVKNVGLAFVEFFLIIKLSALSATVMSWMASVRVFGSIWVGIFATMRKAYASFLTMLAQNPYVAVAIFIAGLLTVIKTFNDLADEAIKNELELEKGLTAKYKSDKADKQMNLEMNETLEETIETYERLSKKQNKTKEETKELEVATKSLRRQFPDLISDSNVFGENTDLLATKMQKAKDEAKKYKQELAELDAQITANAKNIGTLETKVGAQKTGEKVISAQGGFLDAVSRALGMNWATYGKDAKNKVFEYAREIIDTENMNEDGSKNTNKDRTPLTAEQQKKALITYIDAKLRWVKGGDWWKKQGEETQLAVYNFLLEAQTSQLKVIEAKENEKNRVVYKTIDDKIDAELKAKKKQLKETIPDEKKRIDTYMKYLTDRYGLMDDNSPTDPVLGSIREMTKSQKDVAKQDYQAEISNAQRSLEDITEKKKETEKQAKEAEKKNKDRIDKKKASLELEHKTQKLLSEQGLDFDQNYEQNYIDGLKKLLLDEQKYYGKDKNKKDALAIKEEIFKLQTELDSFTDVLKKAKVKNMTDVYAKEKEEIEITYQEALKANAKKGYSANQVNQMNHEAEIERDNKLHDAKIKHEKELQDLIDKNITEQIDLQAKKNELNRLANSLIDNPLLKEFADKQQEWDKKENDIKIDMEKKQRELVALIDADRTNMTPEQLASHQKTIWAKESEIDMSIESLSTTKKINTKDKKDWLTSKFHDSGYADEKKKLDEDRQKELDAIEEVGKKEEQTTEDIEKVKYEIKKAYREKYDALDAKYHASSMGRLLGIPKETEENFNKAWDGMKQVIGNFSKKNEDSVNKDIDKRKELLNERLKAEETASSGFLRTEAQKEHAKQQFEKKRKEEEHKLEVERLKRTKVWFEINKGIQIAEAVMSTSNAIMSAWKLPAPMNFIMAALAATVGDTEIALIASQKMPEAKYKTGGYTGNINENDVAGVVHGKEFVVNKEGTEKHRDLLEDINKGNDIGVIRSALDLIGGDRGISSSANSFNRGLTVNNNMNVDNLHKEVAGLRKDLLDIMNNPVSPILVVDNSTSHKITQRGLKQMKRDSF